MFSVASMAASFTISTIRGTVLKDCSVTASGRPWLIKFCDKSTAFGGPYSRRESDPEASEPARNTSLIFSEGFWKNVFDI